MTENPALRLLLVEDEPTQMMLNRRKLQKAGYSVDTANNGEEALEKISRNRYQILVTDWDMPGMDGPTLCQKVRAAELPGYLYILLLTSHDSTQSLVEGLEKGADDYIRKSADDAELFARVKAGQRIVLLEQSLREANEKIQRLSIIDPLLNTYNRRYLNDNLVQEVEQACRYSRQLSVIMADLDRFKSVNDRYGHLVGDEVLRVFVERAQESVRATDWIARYGGEEFVIVLPETPLDGAIAAAEKVRHRCASAPFVTEAGELSVTSSFGVASLQITQDAAIVAAAELLRDADAALYRSKREGRNRVSPPDKG